MTNLVPDDLLSSPDDSTYEPRHVLDELAAELAAKTDQRVLGEVRTDYPRAEVVRHQFSLRSLATNYRYDLFDVYHGIHEYPVRLRGPVQIDGPSEIANREQFERALAHIFAAPATRKLIKQLARMDA